MFDTLDTSGDTPGDLSGFVVNDMVATSRDEPGGKNSLSACYGVKINSTLAAFENCCVAGYLPADAPARTCCRGTSTARTRTNTNPNGTETSASGRLTAADATTMNPRPRIQQNGRLITLERHRCILHCPCSLSSCRGVANR